MHEMSYSTIAGVQHSNYQLKVLYPMSRPELPNLPIKVQKEAIKSVKLCHERGECQAESADTHTLLSTAP
jgi:hypothetical protein